MSKEPLLLYGYDNAECHLYRLTEAQFDRLEQEDMSTTTDCKDHNKHASSWVLSGTAAVCPICKVVMHR